MLKYNDTKLCCDLNLIIFDYKIFWMCLCIQNVHLDYAYESDIIDVKLLIIYQIDLILNY